MAEVEGHRGRKDKIVARYHADQTEFFDTLRSISRQAWNRLQTSPSRLEGHCSLETQQAKAIVQSGVYFPRSAMLYLQRCIRCRNITSWYCKLHMPYSPEEAKGVQWKERANEGFKKDTASHEYHVRKLKKLKKILEKCANLSDSGFTSRLDDAVCQDDYPDNALEEAFTEQRTYLMERRDGLRPKTTQTIGDNVQSRKGSVGDLYPETMFRFTSEYAHLILVKA